MNDRLVRLFGLAVVLLVTACTAPPADDDDEDEDPNPLPAFVDDCTSQQNDTIDTPAGIVAENRWEQTGLQLCDDGEDVDYYRVDIPAGKWLTVRIDIDGDGVGGDDLDMYEVDDEDEVLWASAASQPYERLGWYNPGSDRLIKLLRVEGYNGAGSDYDLLVRSNTWHAGESNCDDAYPDEDEDDEDGPCNRIMQFPQANDPDGPEGYVAYHQPHYSNLRREVAYLVQWATGEVQRQFPDTDTLGLFDMSQTDGDTPGRMVGQLRHPEGTHVDGNDIDISYYYNNGNSLSGYACSDHDAYFCDDSADLLDVERTTYLLALLTGSPNVRVIGIDPAVADEVIPMAYELEDDGIIDADARSRLIGYLAYGPGWPFHHHHLHFSWNWEGGFEGREAPVDGCLLQPELDPTE